MKKTVRAIFLTVLSMAVFLSAGVFPANAATGQCEYYTGSNIGSQSYNVWSKPVYSYLTITADSQLMRFQGNAATGKYAAEYYDSDYNLSRSVEIDAELPIFGAFYSDGTNYYVLSGQMNPEENDSVEVYRLTKYDLDWNRIGSAGLFGANTYIPFDAGSARIDSDGNLLFVRTCHEMYQSSDGYHHQANVTIEFNTAAMEVVDSFYSVMNVGYGYVSHSFNQFIKLDGGHIIGVDHGDAYPRAVVLCKYSSSYSASGFSKNTTAKNLLSIPGQTGNNATGVSVGGFEMSAGNYLVAGNTVDLGDSYSTGGTRNIFVAVLPKDLSSAAAIKYITSYAEGSSSPQTPHLVKVSDNDYVVLWGKDDAVSYCRIDSSGNMIGDIFSMEGALSDCVPVLHNGKLIWYTWKNEVSTFYSINVKDLSDTASESVLNGHKFQIQYATENNNAASRVCSVCGYQESFTTVDGFSVWWWHGYSGSSYISSRQSEGDEYEISLRSSSPADAENTELELITSDPSVIAVDGYTFRFVGTGEATLTIRAKYRPTVSISSDFFVYHVLGNETIVREADCTEAGLKRQICAVCGETVDTEIPASGHDWGEWTVAKEATEEAAGLEVRICERNDAHKEERIIPSTGHIHHLVKADAVDATCTNDGNIEYWLCDKCHKFYSDADAGTEIDEAGIIISAKGHKEEILPAVDPTCTETGKTAGSKCSVCLEVLAAQEEIPALGHHLSAHAAATATCTASGNSAYWSCDRCGRFFSDEAGEVVIETGSWIIAANGHKWDHGDIKTAATCTEAGVKTYTCTVCEETKTEAIPATGHTEETIPAVAPTCTTAGSTAGTKCSMCGEILTAPEEVPATGHKNIVQVPAKAATLKAAGNIAHYKCTDCGTLFTDAKGTKETTATKVARPKLVNIHTAKVTVANQTYTGKKLTPDPVVKIGTTTLKKGTDYTVEKYSSNTNAGKATVTIKGKGKYGGTTTGAFTIKQATNGITKFSPTSKTLKYNKPKAQTIQVKATARFGTKVTCAKASVTPTKGNGYISVSKAGKVTVKKGTPKGTYTVKVKVTAAGTKNYKAKTVTKSLKIVVK